MPRYGITTFLNKKEMEKVEKVAEKLDMSKYKLLREGVLAYCEACMENGEEKNERVREGSNKPTEENSGETRRETKRRIL